MAYFVLEMFFIDFLVLVSSSVSHSRFVSLSISVPRSISVSIPLVVCDYFYCCFFFF